MDEVTLSGRAVGGINEETFEGVPRSCPEEISRGASGVIFEFLGKITEGIERNLRKNTHKRIAPWETLDGILARTPERIEELWNKK